MDIIIKAQFFRYVIIFHTVKGWFSMYYVYIISAAVIGAIIYFSINRNLCNEHNIMNDVPSLNVDKEGLKKHAGKISNEYSAAGRTNCRKKVIKSLKESYEKILECYLYIDKNFKNKREFIFNRKRI